MTIFSTISQINIFRAALYLCCLQGIACFYSERIFAQAALLDSLRKVWEISQHQADDSAKVMLMNDLSEKYRLYGNDLEKSRFFALSAYRSAVKCGFERGAGDALHRVSLIYFVKSEYDTARRYSASALAIRTKIRDTVGMGRSLNALGLTHQFQGSYDKASEYYFRALPLQESLRDTVGMAVSCDNIGTCYRFQANFPRAIEFHERALELNKATSNATLIPYPLMGLGAVYEAMQQFDQALRYYTDALERRRKLNHRQGVAISLAALGKLYFKLGRKKEALATQFQALALQDSVQDRSGMASSLVEIGRLIAAERRFDEALRYSQKALALAGEIGSKTIMSDAAQLCAEILQRQRRFEEALKYFMQASALRDSIYTRKAAQQLADMAAQRELDKRERDLEILAKENDLKTTWRNALLAVLALLTALLAVILMRYYDNKNANAEILRQQTILAEQAREIELVNTELQQTNDELEEKNAALVQLGEEKNEFLGIATHDLKSPLSSIRLLSGVISDQSAKSSHSEEHEQIRSSAVLIRQLSDQMFALIKNLLDENAIEQGMVRFAKETVDVGGALRLVIGNYRPAAAEKSITLQESLETSLFADADASGVEQIMENLLSNAIKFSPLGGTVKIVLKKGRAVHHNGTESAQNGYICMSISDEGAGITDEDKPRLFGKFARLSARPTGNEHSTGLGLAIVKKVAEAINGKVWCESEVSSGIPGATFIVLFPEHSSS